METGKLESGFCRKTNQPGRFNDGGGLYLLIKPNGSKTWVFRFRDRISGKQHDMGIGVFGPHDVSLKDARITAGECRAMLRETPPKNPIEERRRSLQEAKTARARRMTFGQCAEQYIEAHKAAWKNEKHRAQWTATLNTYAADLAPLPVDMIDVAMVIKCLQPIWSTKTETATRVRQRIEAVLDWATVREFRTGENPARWKGHLDNLLAKPAKIKNVTPRAALPYEDIGPFTAKLREKNTLAAKALELQILTATRPGEAVGARWDEINLQTKIWLIPALRMKADKAHEIPLSDRAVEIIESLPRLRNCEYLFPGQSLKKHMTTAAVMKLIKELQPGITAHGFRSCFRDWAADRTRHSRETIEHALAHQLKDKAEAAYKRSTELPKRERLMRDWAKFCSQPISGGNNVTEIRMRAKS